MHTYICIYIYMHICTYIRIMYISEQHNQNEQNGWNRAQPLNMF